MENAPQNQLEQPERNLKDEPMLTVEAMAAVEGPAWMAEQEAMENGAVADGVWQTGLSYALERVTAGRTAEIYGRGGINRWFVEGDGSVSFSESHAESPEHVQKARELGFPIVP
jgi:hypothetical protein